MKVKLPRRTFLYRAAGAAALPVVSSIAWVQAYPTRPVRFIHGFAAGGSGDIAARLIAQLLSDRLGQQFIVENRTGAGGNIAVEAVARAPADGYTLLQLNVANAINTALYEKLNFNLLNDIVPVASFMRVPNVMEVTLSLPVKTVPEFIAYARANPGRISFASSGVGSSIHMSGELFKAMAKIDMLHVPYRGIAAGGLSDLMPGVVHVAFDNLPHRTGHEDFPHPALGQDFTPSPTARRAQAGTGVRARSARKGARVDKSRPCVAWFCAWRATTGATAQRCSCRSPGTLW